MLGLVAQGPSSTVPASWPSRSLRERSSRCRLMAQGCHQPVTRLPGSL